METEQVVIALSALAHNARLAVFRALVQAGPDGLPAGRLAERVSIPASSLSFHLKELTHAGLIRSRQAGRFVIYTAEYGVMNGLLGFLTENCCGGASCAPDCSPVVVSPSSLAKEPSLKRLHVHIAVEDIAASIRFYSVMFASAPTVTQPDYAKWMLDDPRVNFAISARGAAPGLNHLGVQVDSDAELEAMGARLSALESGVVAEKGSACCYAQSDKYWATDPQGVAWETFHTLDSIPVYGANDASTCCVPEAGAQAGAPAVTSRAGGGCGA